MAITSYSELQTAAANWLNRGDLTLRIPEFIVLAEAKFNRIVRAPDMITKNDAFTVDSQYETLPSGFLEARRFTLLTSPVRALEYITPEEMSEKRELYTSSSKPFYYSVVGGNFEFLPTPDSAYTASLIYYAALTTVSSSWNWLATNHPDIYLFGTLLEASAYLHDDTRVPLWSARLQSALDQLRVMNDRKQVGNTPRARVKAF